MKAKDELAALRADLETLRAEVALLRAQAALPTVPVAPTVVPTYPVYSRWPSCWQCSNCGNWVYGSGHICYSMASGGGINMGTVG